MFVSITLRNAIIRATQAALVGGSYGYCIKVSYTLVNLRHKRGDRIISWKMSKHEQAETAKANSLFLAAGWAALSLEKYMHNQPTITVTRTEAITVVEEDLDTLVPDAPRDAAMDEIVREFDAPRPSAVLEHVQSIQAKGFGLPLPKPVFPKNDTQSKGTH